MNKRYLYASALCLLTLSMFKQAYASGIYGYCGKCNQCGIFVRDTIPPADVMGVVSVAIYSLNKFDIDAVANLYTPNATVADDEPPYSWNGPTAGVQWVNAVEQACKDNRITRLKGSIEPVNVFQQNGGNVYIIVPVDYIGTLPGRATFEAHGAFAFVLRMINGKWMIKSQVWMPRKAMP